MIHHHARRQKNKYCAFTPMEGMARQKRAERSGFALNCEALIETIEETLLSK